MADEDLTDENGKPRHREAEKHDDTYLSDKTANRVIAVVTAVWVLNVVAGVAGKYTGYEPSDLIHGIFLAVVGGAFALKNQKKDR